HVKQPTFGVLNAGLTAHRDKKGIVEFFRPGDVVAPDHNMAEHSVLSSSESHAPAAPALQQNTVYGHGVSASSRGVEEVPGSQDRNHSLTAGAAVSGVRARVAPGGKLCQPAEVMSPAFGMAGALLG